MNRGVKKKCSYFLLLVLSIFFNILPADAAEPTASCACYKATPAGTITIDACYNYGLDGKPLLKETVNCDQFYEPGAPPGYYPTKCFTDTKSPECHSVSIFCNVHYGEPEYPECAEGNTVAGTGGAPPPTAPPGVKPITDEDEEDEAGAEDGAKPEEKIPGSCICGEPSGPTGSEVGGYKVSGPSAGGSPHAMCYTADPSGSPITGVGQCAIYQKTPSGSNKGIICKFIANDTTCEGLGSPPKPKFQFTPIIPETKINIPTLQPFTKGDITFSEEGGQRYINIPFIGRYIAAIYMYLISIVGIWAVVLIANAGLVWIQAGGDAQKINDARDRITHALTGLLMVIGSYTFLYFINPSLVELKSLQIPFIEREEFGDNHGDGDPFPTPEPQTLVRSDDPSKPSPDSFVNHKTVEEGGLFDKLNYKGFTSGKRELSSITFIILHEGGSPGSITDYWIKNATYGLDPECTAPGKPKKLCKGPGDPPRYYPKVSSHYSIDNEGHIYQLLGEEKIAHHAGVGNYNAKSIGIDLFAKSKTRKGVCSQKGGRDPADCSYSNATYRELKKLITTIAGRTGASFDDAHVLGHCELGVHSDPGNFNWSQIGLNNSNHKPCATPVEPKGPKATCCVDGIGIGVITGSECSTAGGQWLPGDTSNVCPAP